MCVGACRAHSARRGPDAPSEATKRRAYESFMAAQRAATTRESACLSCAQRLLPVDAVLLPLDFASFAVLKPSELQAPIKAHYENSTPQNRLPHGLMTHAAAMTNASGQSALRDMATHAHVCATCHNALTKKPPTLPRAALANDNATGIIPDELRDLTLAERRAIALVSVRATILRCAPNTSQLAMHGHVLFFEAQPLDVDDETLTRGAARELPLPRAHHEALAYVVFAGNLTPAAKTLALKEYTVRTAKLRAALAFLRRHNPLYNTVVVNQQRIDELANAPLCTSPESTIDALVAANEDDQSIATRGEDVTIGGGALVAALDRDGREVDADSPHAVLRYTVSESVAIMPIVPPTGSAAANTLRERIRSIAQGDSSSSSNDGNNGALHVVNRTGALCREHRWRILAFPWLFPYGLGDPANKQRRVALHETDADVSLLLRW